MRFSLRKLFALTTALAGSLAITNAVPLFGAVLCVLTLAAFLAGLRGGTTSTRFATAASLRHFLDYGRADLVGGLILIELPLPIAVWATLDDARFYWSTYSFAVYLVFGFVVAPILLAIAIPESRKRRGCDPIGVAETECSHE
jgi:hypothetical protein